VRSLAWLRIINIQGKASEQIKILIKQYGLNECRRSRKLLSQEKEERRHCICQEATRALNRVSEYSRREEEETKVGVGERTAQMWRERGTKRGREGEREREG
jgi:hypothetical protein